MTTLIPIQLPTTKILDETLLLVAIPEWLRLSCGKTKQWAVFSNSYNSNPGLHLHSLHCKLK